MKPKTKTQAIINAFLAGEKLTVKSCMRLIGTYKISNRIREIEDKYNVVFKREKVSSKSRYGGIDHYLQYSLPKVYFKNFNRQKT
jgi:hypothetical protein